MNMEIDDDAPPKAADLFQAINIEELPPNRFELELEFVQALASPAYLHFLATTKSETGDCLLLQEPEFMDFLLYLRSTWSKPEYSRFINYPNCLVRLAMRKLLCILRASTLSSNTLCPLSYMLLSKSTMYYASYIRNTQYFLELLIDKPSVVKEWTLPAFRNFCHQQQFLSWCVSCMRSSCQKKARSQSR